MAVGPCLDSDAVFGIEDDLIVAFDLRTGPIPDGRAITGGWRHLTPTLRVHAERADSRTSPSG